MNSIMNALMLVICITIISKEFKYIKELRVPTKKSYLEIICICIGIGAVISITCLYADNLFEYLIGILGIIMIISMWVKEGISDKGFISTYRYKEIILWHEIKKINIRNSENIKVEVLGKFIEQTFVFKKQDYNKIINILEDNLHRSGKFTIDFIN